MPASGGKAAASCAGKGEDKKKEPKEKDICIICQELLNKTKTETKTLPCSHTFHTACLIPWLRSNDTCPCCRTKHANLSARGELLINSESPAPSPMHGGQMTWMEDEDDDEGDECDESAGPQCNCEICRQRMHCNQGCQLCNEVESPWRPGSKVWSCDACGKVLCETCASVDMYELDSGQKQLCSACASKSKCLLPRQCS